MIVHEYQEPPKRPISIIIGGEPRAKEESKAKKENVRYQLISLVLFSTKKVEMSMTLLSILSLFYVWGLDFLAWDVGDEGNYCSRMITTLVHQTEKNNCTVNKYFP